MAAKHRLFPMNFSKNSLANLAALSLLLSAVLLVVIRSPDSISILFSSYSDSTAMSLPIDELEWALEKAAMPNRTVIIAVVNKAYVEQSVDAETTMLDLFLESFWLGEGTRPLLDYLLLVAVDQTAYDRCQFKRLHCYKLETDGVDFGGEKVFMSQDFIKMMWRRTLFLLDVLKRGYNFIFTDTDVMWLRNPFAVLRRNESVDLQISLDFGRTHLINTGFYYIRSNNKTISLFKTWYEMKDNSTGLKEQDVLTNLLKEGKFWHLGIRVMFLTTKRFSGFCQDSTDFRAVTTVHANCCRHITAKVQDLIVVLRDWKRFKATPKLTSGTNITFRWSPHVTCFNSWNDTKYNPLA